MTTINAAGGLPYHSYNAKESPARLPIEEPLRVIGNLKSSLPPGGSGELKQRLLQASTFDALAMLPPEAADNTAAKIWGNIEVGGQVVAQIYDSGGVTSKSNYQLPQKFWDSSDPIVRARGLIEAYGGKLVMRNQLGDAELFKG